jgi:hypothetical protein
MSSTLEPEEADVQVLDIVYPSDSVIKAPVKAKLQDFDNQRVGGQEQAKASYVRRGGAWRQTDSEGTRQIIPLCFVVGLFVVWFLVGLVVLLKTGNLDLLVSASGTLVVLLTKMINNLLPFA